MISPNLVTTYARSQARTALRQSRYTLTELPLAIARFVVLVPLCVLGAATTPIGIGIPILALNLRLAQAFAELDGSPTSRPHLSGDRRTRRGAGPATRGSSR